ncbi:heterodisulfide reductase-related iron-sulfur binding cluster [Thermodesulfobacteriota bacterium]
MALLAQIPGVSVDTNDGPFYCCGVAGVMGFKREFHKNSIKIGGKLMGKIRKLDTERLVTDCLSCRTQFNQLTAYQVFHPIEIMKEAYDNYWEDSAPSQIQNSG